MSKRIALKDGRGRQRRSIELLTFGRVSTSEHERVDVSGFNATGANEYLAGQTTQSVTVEHYGSYGTGEVHATLYPIHKDREIVAFAWRPDQTAVASRRTRNFAATCRCSPTTRGRPVARRTRSRWSTRPPTRPGCAFFTTRP